MNCPNCSTPHAQAARFCAKCGASLKGSADRTQHYAAMPDQPVKIAAMLSTLLPHLAGRHQYTYRRAIALALLASLIAAAVGSLSVSLVLAAIALPAMILTYFHDHNVWRGQPLAVIAVGFVLALALGVGVGRLQAYLGKGFLLEMAGPGLPPVSRILQFGLVIPVIIYLAVLIAPMVLTAKPAFRHPVDAVVTSALSGSAFSLGYSIVMQWGAFTKVDALAGDAAHVAFIALTLGVAQPVIFATAAVITVVPMRYPGGHPAVGVFRGLILVVFYSLVSTLLAPFGARGIVLTAVVALTIAAAGLIASRLALQDALVGKSGAVLSGDRGLTHPAHADESCAHCGALLDEGDAFCKACGSASATLGRYVAPTTAKAKR